MTDAPILEASGIGKSFGVARGWFAPASATRVLDDVALSLHPGEILGLVGESGCGKSTLAKVLAGLVEPDAGELVIAGKTILAPNRPSVPASQRGIQMVFQDPVGSLDPRMRGGALVGEGLLIRGGMSGADIRAAVRRTLALVGLGEDALDRHAHEFSGGQRQRLCMARAVILQPKILIADEAVSALDVSVQLQILNLLLDLRDRLGIAILFISHDIGVIEYLCDRVMVMYGGRIVEEGPLAQVVDRPAHPYTAVLLEARPRRDGGPPARAVAAPSGNDDAPAGCCFYARCGRRMARCRSEQPPLAPLAAGAAARVACFDPLTM
jgi:oligopeptide/dipeptide ABC transporter ATP-binding protein